MSTFKPWRDKTWLEQKYVKERKTIEKIAEECTLNGTPVTPMTIWNNLKKFNLLKNSRNLGSRRVGGTGKGFYG